MENINTATMPELLAFFNANSGKPPVKKFADLKTARRRVAAIAEYAGQPLTEEAPVKPINTKEAAVAAAKKAVKKTTKPKAKKAAAKPKTAAERSAAIAESWKDSKVAKARATHHGVKVKGEEYRSVLAAFEALKLPVSRHIPFRAKLKAAGSAIFDNDGDKYTFTLVKKEKA